MGIAIGLMTEYATGVSFIDQLKVGWAGQQARRAGRQRRGCWSCSHAVPRSGSFPRSRAQHCARPPARCAAHGLLHGPGGPGLSLCAQLAELHSVGQIGRRHCCTHQRSCCCGHGPLSAATLLNAQHRAGVGPSSLPFRALPCAVNAVPAPALILRCAQPHLGCFPLFSWPRCTL